MALKGPWSLAAIVLSTMVAACVSTRVENVSNGRSSAREALLASIRAHPAYALDWHKLRLAVVDDQTASQLKNAPCAGRKLGTIQATGAYEQSLWLDAANNHPEPALNFYDGNIYKYPDDHSYLNTSCWARSVHAIDLAHVMSFCNAAVAAERKPYVLVNRGIAELQLGSFKEAVADFDEALGDPSFRGHFMTANAVYGRGVARIRLGDADGQKDISVATRANPNVSLYF